jgi:hypothetical protein
MPLLRGDQARPSGLRLGGPSFVLGIRPFADVRQQYPLRSMAEYMLVLATGQKQSNGQSANFDQQTLPSGRDVQIVYEYSYWFCGNNAVTISVYRKCTSG